jgi:hypothetical protein
MSDPNKPAHTLIVTVDPQHPSGDPAEHQYRIVCGGVTDACRTFAECLLPGCDKDVLDAAEDDGDDEPVAHGVAHRNIGDLGWSVKESSCSLPLYPAWVDEARELNLTPGTYRFRHQWEDGGEWFSIELLDEAKVDAR